MLCLSRSVGVLALALSLATTVALCASEGDGHYSLKTTVLLSPPFFLRPGSVVNTFFYDVDFPRGHIAIKSFNAEVVDDEGNPVPLHETYLHHWTMFRYYGRVESEVPRKGAGFDHHLPKMILVRNSGPCLGPLGQYFGIGSETRKTDTWVPDPYGIEVGNPKLIPNGYEERWMMNVHAIDTRGTEDRLGCTEGKCSLYNVTEDENGRPLRKHYVGGAHCCYDQMQCRLREGFQDINRKLHMRYTVKWVEWGETSIVPVKIYLFDVADTGTRWNDSTGTIACPSCNVEYDVKPCGVEGTSNGGECIDNKKTTIPITRGGDIIYAVGHQHSGGIGAALYGQDGRLLCKSTPIYGTGTEAGNEAGYIVGMSACYPRPGSVKVDDWEFLTLESNYSSSKMHLGVMGHFYFMVADPQPTTTSFITSTFQEEEDSLLV